MQIKDIETKGLSHVYEVTVPAADMESKLR